MEKSRQGRSIVFSRYVDKRTQAHPAFTSRTLGWRGMASEAPHFLEKNLSLLGVSLFLPSGKAFLQAQTPEECRQSRSGLLAVPVTHRTQQVGHLGSLVSPKRVGEKFEQVSGRDSLPDLSQIRSMSPGQRVGTGTLMAIRALQFPKEDFTRLLQPHCRIASDPENFRRRIQLAEQSKQKDEATTSPKTSPSLHSRASERIPIRSNSTKNYS